MLLSRNLRKLRINIFHKRIVWNHNYFWDKNFFIIKFQYASMPCGLHWLSMFHTHGLVNIFLHINITILVVKLHFIWHWNLIQKISYKNTQFMTTVENHYNYINSIYQLIIYMCSAPLATYEMSCFFALIN